MAFRCSNAAAIALALEVAGCSSTAAVPPSPGASAAAVTVASPAPSEAASPVVPVPSGPASASEVAASPSAPSSAPSAALVEVAASRCQLPPSRPVGTTVRFTRFQLPIGRPPSQEGIEVHAEVACPAADGPRASLPVLPCKAVSAKALDDLYGIIRKAGFERWGHRNEAGSPHYGSRTIEIVLPNRICSFSDSTSAPIAAGSEKAFHAAVDVIIGI